MSCEENLSLINLYGEVKFIYFEGKLANTTIPTTILTERVARISVLGKINYDVGCGK